ncbi:MAG: TetR/AcrR family transcriptional regulator C-terminal domain-containing protein [Deltaproteobacteria bacterium]|nr:TetR/AcrR family transcriptional regulator C-terminal domain-containing protein [Deltaproteobacteria bacterium]MDQ3299430.1 TetR/AcrR family transcriptional regulator C-terminal domain-containing protein [Myxococcota bacterium]
MTARSKTTTTRTRTAPRKVAAVRTKTRTARRAAPPGLSHDVIRIAALALIDEDGLADFSTRKLGRVLGCEAMAIYWYYPSKEALLDAVVDQLMMRVAAVVSGRAPIDWIGALRDVAHAYRGLAHDHPKAFPLLATRRFASESTYAFLEELFELARRQGIEDRITARFYRVVSSYCSGFALNELATLHGPKDPGIAALRRRYTRVAAVSAWLEPRHLDETFEFGLELQLAALAGAPGAAPMEQRR